METKQAVDSILEAVREELSHFVETESEITSALDYEKRVFELAMKFARETIDKSQGKMPKSRNLKKRY